MVVKAWKHHEALVQVIADLKVRWKFYRERYEGWTK
jgi:hypothetical protein